jgi:hypothetical protein
MLCTKCQSVITPVVAIDIDGTIGNYHDHFLGFAEDYIGQVIMPDYTGSFAFRDWFKKVTGESDDTWHDIKLAYRQGGQKRSMPMYSFADELCRRVRRHGAELWVTTTRPYIRHDNIDPDTREWLRRNRIEYDYLIYDGDKYNKLCELVGKERVCAVLDDLAEELEAADAEFGDNVPIMRQTKFNLSINRHYDKAKDLKQATELILDRISAWRKQHATEEEVPVT